MSRISGFFIIYFSICTNAIVVQNLGLNQGKLSLQNSRIIEVPHTSKILAHHPAEIISVQPITSHFIKTSTYTSDDSKDFDIDPRYSFAYDIKDLKTGDDKQQEEKLSEGQVQGKYSLVEPDGTRRTVSYTANDLNGFNAVVSKEPALNQNILFERQKIFKEENQNLEKFQQQLKQHQIEIEEEQQRQQEEFRKSIIRQKNQLTKEQLKHTLIEKQEKLAADKLRQTLAVQQEQKLRSEGLILSRGSSILDHSIQSTIIHQNIPTLEIDTAPVLTSNHHISPLETHPSFIKSFGLANTQILSGYPTTLLQRQYFSSPSVEYASKINLHTTGLNSEQYHKLSEDINITVGKNDANEEDNKSEIRDHNNDANDERKVNDENGSYCDDGNEYNRNDYRSNQKPNKEEISEITENENELITN